MSFFSEQYLSPRVSHEVIGQLVDDVVRERLGLDYNEDVSIVDAPPLSSIKYSHYVMIERHGRKLSGLVFDRWLEPIDADLYRRISSLDWVVARGAADEFFMIVQAAVRIFKSPWRHLRDDLPDVSEAIYYLT